MENNLAEVISKNISVYFEKCELPEFYLSYISNILVEEPPVDGHDTFELIGDFLQNGRVHSAEESQKICNEIYDTLNRLNASSTENKLTYVAEKLSAPVTLLEMSVSEREFSGNFNDPFITNDRFMYNEDFNTEKQKKKKEKDDKKAMEAYRKHIESIQASKQKLPPATLQHNRQGIKFAEILCDNVSLQIGGKILLESTKLNLVAGRKYGLIGRNGIGKTTLMMAIAKREVEKMPMDLQILLVEQEVIADEQTPLEIVLRVDKERDDLLKEEANLQSNKDENSQARLVEVMKRLEEIDAFNTENKVSTILAGLGFTQKSMRQQTKFLSGGWRMRVSLAKALFAKPDILLLDEPTNHLDLDAVMWLEDYLMSCKNTVVIVSHAREFLNVVCTDIIHFQDQKLSYYRGDYDSFEKTRNEFVTRNKKQVETQTKKIEHMQKFIDKFRYNAKRASLVQSRIKTLNKMDMVEEIFEDPSCVFIFPTPEKLRPPLIKIDDASFGYSSEELLLTSMNFSIDTEARIAILGANGVGKSTFLKIIQGNLQIQEGSVYRHSRIKTGMFSQHHMDQLDLMLSPLEQLSISFPGSSTEAYRSHLSKFGITTNLQIRPMYLMSGGQKSRVALAVVLWKNPHLLILDEPTNHLDLDAVNALIVALSNYEGCVIIVSHDQHLVSSVCENIWYIKDYRLKKFGGDFNDYKVALATGKL